MIGDNTIFFYVLLVAQTPPYLWVLPTESKIFLLKISRIYKLLYKKICIYHLYYVPEESDFEKPNGSTKQYTKPTNKLTIFMSENWDEVNCTDMNHKAATLE